MPYRASQDGGEGWAATVVHVVEEPLVHHLATVPLFIIPAQVLSLSGKLSRQGGDLRLLHVGEQGLAEGGRQGLQELARVHRGSGVHLRGWLLTLRHL